MKRNSAERKGLQRNTQEFIVYAVKSYIAGRPPFGVAVILLERRVWPRVSPLRGVWLGRFVIAKRGAAGTIKKEENPMLPNMWLYAAPARRSGSEARRA